MTKKQEEWRKKQRMIIVEDTWAMMRWLTQYIEENKYEWERRREREKATTNKDYEKFSEMEEQEMIMMLQEQEERERLEKETKIEKAARRKRYWKVKKAK